MTRRPVRIRPVALMRGHTLLQRMREVDGDLISRGMTVGAADVLGFAADTLAHRVRELHRWRGSEPPADPMDLGHTVARLIHSLVLTPGGGPDLDPPASARRYAASVVVPLILGPLVVEEVAQQPSRSLRRPRS
jgi:hypothetical protein